MAIINSNWGIMMFSNKRILVVVAHPDDEVLGCGGTITQYIKKGALVHELILCGTTKRFENNKEKTLAIRDQINKAATVLGSGFSYIYDFPDNEFDTIPLLEIVKAIEKVKKDMRPNVIFTHHGGDLNIDHRRTYEAVMTACRPTKDETVKEIYSFEIPSSTDWNYPNTFSPNLFVDIEESMDIKTEAMQIYQSECQPWPHPRSVKALEILAQKRGSEVGLNKAEAFEVIRKVVRVWDMPEDYTADVQMSARFRDKMVEDINVH